MRGRSAAICMAADEIGAVYYDRIKVTFGQDGTATDVSSANPLPVSIVSGGGSSSGGLTDAELRATPVAVSGTFWQATQPISGTVGISGTVPVSGTFWQVTQPVSIAATVNVSGPLTDAQLRAAAVPVSGTFWQATQPVSIASTVAVSGPLTDGQLRASAVPISGTVTANAGSGTFAVSGPLTDAQLRAGAVPVSGTVTITPPTLTKGAQGSTGLSTQDLKDAGRVLRVFSASFTAATTEALVTLTPITDGTAGATGTTFAVTSGKRLRLQSFSVSTKNAGAAGQGVVCNLRITATGAVAANSPLIATCAAGTYLATANVTNGNCVTFPDGFELSGNMQFGISQIGTATAGNTVTLIGYEY
jgi:hypothetical protein